MIAQVYRNLHKGCYSVRDKRSRKVVDHKDTVILKDATFRVSEKGRQRVLREKRKNVHAWVEGEVVDDAWSDGSVYDLKFVVYNPYKFNSFVDENREPVRDAQFVFLTPQGVFAYQKVEVGV